MHEKLINILLVDDDPGDRRLVELTLKRSRQPVEFVLETAASLTECLEHLKNDSFDLLLLDLGLPDSQGLDTVDKVCKACPQTPIVVLTGLADEETGVEAIKRGANDYLVKSKFFRDLLVRTIRYALERKQAEKALRDSEERYRTLVENIHLGITLIDADHRIIMTNLGQGRLFTKPHAEFVGKHCFREFEKRDAVCSHCPGTRAMATGQPAQSETEGMRDDGSRFPVRIQAFPVFGDDGATKAFIEVVEDITERKQAEDALKTLNEELEATVEKLTKTNRELEDFAYVVSHDLKAPLRGIKTLTEWISADYADKIDENGVEQLNLLSNRADRMHNLIEGILQYSRIGRVKEEQVPINLNELVPQVIDLITRPENISITVENELPTITFEPTRVTQVFQNLLSNAVKYMDKPQGQVRVGCVEDNESWKFSVADNGPGIDQKHFERIFRMFQTLLPKDEFESTGIGLTVTKKIIEMYGGKIWVESEPGQGTTFLFTFPKQEPEVINAEFQTNNAC